jgi:hypothetical protein
LPGCGDAIRHRFVPQEVDSGSVSWSAQNGLGGMAAQTHALPARGLPGGRGSINKEFALSPC